MFLLNLFAKTPCLAPLGVELSRTPDGTQPGISQLMSFKSQSPRILISIPCAVTQANPGSSRRGGGGSDMWEAMAEAAPPSRKADASPRSSVFDYVKTLPSLWPPASPGVQGQGLRPLRRPRSGHGGRGRGICTP